MAYRVFVDREAAAEIEAVPAEALAPLFEAFEALELAPWSGQPYHERDPSMPMRTLTFSAGRGLIAYLIVEDETRVDVVRVTWLGTL